MGVILNIKAAQQNIFVRGGGLGPSRGEYKGGDRSIMRGGLTSDDRCPSPPPENETLYGYPPKILKFFLSNPRTD